MDPMLHTKNRTGTTGNLRVLFVVEYYPPHQGGAEMLFANLAEGLARNGHQVTVVTCLVPGSRPEEMRNGVQVKRVRVPKNGDRYWFAVLSLVCVLRHVRFCDIVHTATYTGAFAAWVCGRLAKKPLVMLAHEVLGRQWFALEKRRMLALAYRVVEEAILTLPFDGYSANSKSTEKALLQKGIPGNRIFQIYPGVDSLFFGKNNKTRTCLRRQFGISQNEFVALFFGRPGITKGVRHLVSAAKNLAEQIPNFRLLLILSDQPRSGFKEIHRQVRTLGLSCVTIAKSVSRPVLRDVVRAVDCVVIPSLTEGFGFSCAEASLLGTPVVATSAGSLPEVVSGVHVLVKPNSARSLAQGILDVYENKTSKIPVREFSRTRAVDEHESLYRRLIEDKASS